MNLVKAGATIGGLTMVSRVLGFARDMIASRMLGASHANDAFNLAFLLPNIFRRLFAEGAFSAGLRAAVQPPPDRRAGTRTPSASPTRSSPCSCRRCCSSPLLFEIAMPAVIARGRGGLCRHAGQARAGDRAHPLDLPLSAVHQPGRPALGRAQFADPVRDRRLRAGAAQRGVDRRPAGGAQRRHCRRADDGDRGARRRDIAVRFVLGRGPPRRHSASLRPAADDPGGAGSWSS